MPQRLKFSPERYNFEETLIDGRNMLPGNLQYRYIDLYFTSATIIGWKHLLRQDKYKQVIVDSLEYLAREKTVKVYAFVIMPNHFHLSVLLLRDEVVLQKMRYIHRNPIEPKWQLSNTPADYCCHLQLIMNAQICNGHF